MGSRVRYFVALAVWIGAVWGWLGFADWWRQPAKALPTARLEWADFFSQYILPTLPVAEDFTTPLRPPDGDGVKISLPFLEEGHLGEDWVTGPGDATLGEPVYSLADGWVEAAADFQNAWGKVVFLCYRQPEGRWPTYVEVMVAQLQTLQVQGGQFVSRGQRLGTVGNANGLYKAHLHWEVRQSAGLGLGPGFGTRRDGWMDPSDFLAGHRGSRAKLPLLPQVVTKEKRSGGEWGTDE